MIDAQGSSQSGAAKALQQGEATSQTQGTTKPQGASDIDATAQPQVTTTEQPHAASPGSNATFLYTSNYSSPEELKK